MIKFRGRSLPRTSVVALVTGALTLVPTAVWAVPIAARTAAPTVHEYQADAYGQHSVRTYGSAADPAKTIVISAETTEVVLDPGLGFVGQEVNCGAVGPSPTALDGFYAVAPDWFNNSMPTVAVLPGAVTAGSGTVFLYHCYSAEYEYFSASDEVVWEFVEGPGAGETVTLGHDETLLTREDIAADYTTRTDENADPQQVAAGDQFVVSGPAGTWGAAENTQRDVRLDPVGFEGPTVAVEDAAVVPDGSSLTFSLPAEGTEIYQNRWGQLTATTTTASTLAFGATRTVRVSWFSYVQVTPPAKATSTITATLDRLYTVSILRPHLTVTVTAGAVPDAAGAVVVSIDGIDQPARAIKAAATTKVTLFLPQLAKGTHTISARYLGAGNVDASATGTLRLRVLI